MTLLSQWDDYITYQYHKNDQLNQALTLSRFFLCILCHRMRMESSLKELMKDTGVVEQGMKEILSMAGNLPMPEIDGIEELYQQYLGNSLRSGTGSFYTPDLLAAFMTKESLRTHYLHHVSKKAHPYFPLEDVFQQETNYINPGIPEDVLVEQIAWYESLRVLDLSCGSGVFLRQALKVLVKAGNVVFNANEKKRHVTEIIKECAENKITGVEYQPDTRLLAVILVKLQVEKLAAEYGLDTLNGAGIEPDLYCENALSWQGPKKDNGTSPKYSLILGNPPYIGEKGNTEIFNQAKESIFGKGHYEKNMDFSYYFVHKGLDLLALDGLLCYVTTSYFATADGGKKLRKRLQENVLFHWLVYPENVTLFPHAKGQHNLVYCLSLKESLLRTEPVLLHETEVMTSDQFLKSLPSFGCVNGIDDQRSTVFSNSAELFDRRGQLLIRSPGKLRDLLERVHLISQHQLQDLCTINQGIVSGADKMTKGHKKILGFSDVHRGIFVLSQQEKDKLVEDEPDVQKHLKPFYKNSHIKPYFVSDNTSQWLLYFTDENMPSIDWSEPLRRHLEPFKPILSRRREVENGVRKWHSLHWPRNAAIFEEEKIIAPQRSSLNIFGYTAEPWYASADVYFIQRRETCFHSMAYLLLWLNSALCYAWLSYYGKMKGKDLELYATPLKQIPIPKPPSDREEKWMKDQYQKIVSGQRNGDDVLNLVNEADHRFFSWCATDPTQYSELFHHVNKLRKKRFSY